MDLISRDRGTDYAAAAREAAPQAKQIADRFHLVRNLADVLEQLLAHCRAEIRQRQQEQFPEPQTLPARPLPHPKTWKQQPPQQMERKYQAHRSEREDRFQHIMALRAQGLFFSEIAKRVGMAHAALQQWTGRGPGPEAQIGQALHVWPCQASSLTATFAPCCLICADAFAFIFLPLLTLLISPCASPLAHPSTSGLSRLFCRP